VKIHQGRGFEQGTDGEDAAAAMSSGGVAAVSPLPHPSLCWCAETLTKQLANSRPGAPLLQRRKRQNLFCSHGLAEKIQLNSGQQSARSLLIADKRAIVELLPPSEPVNDRRIIVDDCGEINGSAGSPAGHSSLMSGRQQMSRPDQKLTRIVGCFVRCFAPVSSPFFIRSPGDVKIFDTFFVDFRLTTKLQRPVRHARIAGRNRDCLAGREQSHRILFIFAHLFAAFCISLGFFSQKLLTPQSKTHQCSMFRPGFLMAIMLNLFFSFERI